MPRPLPALPHGPRRSPRLRGHVLGVPRLAPDWELGALRALMKPHARRKIPHRSAQQPWPRDAAERLNAVRRLVRDRLGYELTIHLPQAGDFHLVADVPTAELPHAMALALVLSQAMPGVWVALGRLYLRDGVFYRRERGLKLNLVPARNIHLKRGLRAALEKRG